MVGRISLAELLKRGYSKDVAIGRLAGAGTLGFLIPPSNIMIIYGVLGDVSIVKLFTAGFIPGFLLAGCFMAWIMIHTTLKPDLVPATERKVPHRLGGRVSRRSTGARAGGLPDPARARLDVWRPRDAVGGAAVGVLGALIVAGAAGRADAARRCATSPSARCRPAR